jgi:hypothetical protein
MALRPSLTLLLSYAATADTHVLLDVCSSRSALVIAIVLLVMCTLRSAKATVNAFIRSVEQRVVCSSSSSSDCSNSQVVTASARVAVQQL